MSLTLEDDPSRRSHLGRRDLVLCDATVHGLVVFTDPLEPDPTRRRIARGGWEGGGGGGNRCCNPSALLPPLCFVRLDSGAPAAPREGPASGPFVCPPRSTSRVLPGGDQPGARKLKGIDIGTGASCIYPLLGNKVAGWSFLATETDVVSAEWAGVNVRSNGMQVQGIVCRVSGSRAGSPLQKWARGTVYHGPSVSFPPALPYHHPPTLDGSRRRGTSHGTLLRGRVSPRHAKKVDYVLRVLHDFSAGPDRHETPAPRAALGRAADIATAEKSIRQCPRQCGGESTGWDTAIGRRR